MRPPRLRLRLRLGVGVGVETGAGEARCTWAVSAFWLVLCS